MKLTEEQLRKLRDYKRNLDSDNTKNKEIIKKKLLNNDLLIYLLNNKDLQAADAESDEYFGINILPYYMIHPTQTNVQNFVCYTTNFDELDRYNKTVKYMQITFVILCEQKNIIAEDTYMARHDLIGALLLDEFNYTNYFGAKIHCVSDKESVVDTDYACRTLIFEQITDNNITKTRDNIPRTVNKEVHV